MIGQKTAYYRYLPETTGLESNPLGINILDGGYTLIPPGTAYPIGIHNKEHDFDTDSGRILSEYQLVYITRGSGEFESKQTGKISIKEGDLFLLFPGVWHRYAPRPQTGWDEYWIGFNGETARRLMQSPFFSLAEPVISVGHDDALLHLFIETVDALETESAGYPLLTAAWTVEIIARLRTLRQGGGRDSKMEALLRQACCRLQERADQNINIPELAAELGIGYSLFRKVFRETNGVSPAQYHLQLRIQKACDLLANTTYPIARIADELGFCSPYYFSRIFSKKTGQSPRAFRIALRA